MSATNTAAQACEKNHGPGIHHRHHHSRSSSSSSTLFHSRRCSNSRRSSVAELGITPPSWHCPKNDGSFAFNPAFLEHWSMAPELWECLPAELKPSIQEIQRAGAAVFTAWDRLEKLYRELGDKVFEDNSLTVTDEDNKSSAIKDDEDGASSSPHMTRRLPRLTTSLCPGSSPSVPALSTRSNSFSTPVLSSGAATGTGSSPIVEMVTSPFTLPTSTSPTSPIPMPTLSKTSAIKHASPVVAHPVKASPLPAELDWSRRLSFSTPPPPHDFFRNSALYETLSSPFTQLVLRSREGSNTSSGQSPRGGHQFRVPPVNPRLGAWRADVAWLRGEALSRLKHAVVKGQVDIKGLKGEEEEWRKGVEEWLLRKLLLRIQLSELAGGLGGDKVLGWSYG